MVGASLAPSLQAYGSLLHRHRKVNYPFIPPSAAVAFMVVQLCGKQARRSYLNLPRGPNHRGCAGAEQRADNAEWLIALG